MVVQKEMWLMRQRGLRRPLQKSLTNMPNQSGSASFPDDGGAKKSKKPGETMPRHGGHGKQDFWTKRSTGKPETPFIGPFGKQSENAGRLFWKAPRGLKPKTT
jgi:hypothetical protein